MATITGTNSNDTITGTISDDHIDGNDGNDTIYGGGGNDWLYGGLGWTDHLYGGHGDDTFIVRDMLDVAHEYANEGWDTVVSTVSYMLGANIENLTLLAGGTGIGNDLNNEIIGNNADNFLDGRLGNDSLHGGGGTDTADYSSWDAVARGMTVEFDLSPEIGGAYRHFERGGETIYAEWDDLYSVENLRGTNVDDIFHGYSNPNVHYFADNEFWGRGGNDTFEGDLGRDTYHGDDGIDTVDYTYSRAAVTIDLRSGGLGGTAEGDRYTGIERAIGTSFNDSITGTDDDNRISGRAGDDSIFGGNGNDTLIGGAETDIEHLTGGAGRDTFVYLNRGDSNTTATRTGDYIMDFNVNDDLVDLRAVHVDAANLSINNNVSGGIHYARILEDLNHNGQADGNELSINLIVDGTANLTLEDILI